MDDVLFLKCGKLLHVLCTFIADKMLLDSRVATQTYFIRLFVDDEHERASAGCTLTPRWPPIVPAASFPRNEDRKTSLNLPI